ncbi:hypothetical protein ElyMa_003642200 [Elysia marginata]|uniref:Spaetzle domain-containing protein n=1 Tax=Elysia marginata TaxID=1093978 RepID=A0AAV4EVT7_9GAST|nr:hypothetical protein ElyMa_003642200 [Elysia marginata]
MSPHITHLPLLYCLLYYRTNSGRAREFFFESGIVTRDSRSVDIDSLDELFLKDSSHRDVSSALVSQEEKEWTRVQPPGYKHNFHRRVENVLFPWRHTRYFSHEERRRLRPQRNNVKRNSQDRHRLCLSGGFRSVQKMHNQNGYKQMSRGQASPPLDTDRRDNKHCILRNEADVKQLLPGVFISHQELEEIIPFHKTNEVSHERLVSFFHQSHDKSTKHSKLVELSHQRPSLKADKQSNYECGTCFTEIAYDVFREITDVDGNVHQVINFNNAFQFIPVGRCKNEFSSCGGGQGATCRQVYRAHWSFVFSHETGARLVPHEVPSHCECMNIATVEPQGTWRPGTTESE